MFDFDKNFAEYVTAYMKKNKLSPTDVEGVISKLSEKWSKTPIKELGNSSPKEYFRGETDEKLLVDMLCTSAESGMISPLLSDRIAQLPSTTPLLQDIFVGQRSEKQKIAAARLLIEKGSVPYDLFVKILTDEAEGNELKELIAESLCYEADKVKEPFLRKLLDIDEERRKLICEILSYCEHDDRVFSALTDCFISSCDIPFSTALLARYGDIRGVDIMKEYAAECNYNDFIELRNGIEQLGGDFDIQRDWTDEERQ